jgi:hypothetical protein
MKVTDQGTLVIEHSPYIAPSSMLTADDELVRTWKEAAVLNIDTGLLFQNLSGEITKCPIKLHPYFSRVRIYEMLFRMIRTSRHQQNPIKELPNCFDHSVLWIVTNNGGRKSENMSSEIRLMGVKLNTSVLFGTSW